MLAIARVVGVLHTFNTFPMVFSYNTFPMVFSYNTFPMVFSFIIHFLWCSVFFSYLNTSRSNLNQTSLNGILSSLSVRSKNQSFNNSVVLGSLAIYAQAHH